MNSTAPYVISATDQSGLIVIIETLFMSWMILVSFIRLYMRLAINGPVQIDDVVVFVGGVSIHPSPLSPASASSTKGEHVLIFLGRIYQVLAIAHVGAVMNAISHGFGRSQDQSSSRDLERAGQVSDSSPSRAQTEADELIFLDSGCLCSKSPVSGWTRRR